jgi:hypothetical protein
LSLKTALINHDTISVLTSKEGTMAIADKERTPRTTKPRGRPQKSLFVKSNVKNATKPKIVKAKIVKAKPKKDKPKVASAKPKKTNKRKA